MTNQITEYQKTEAALADLKKQLDGVVFDCTTPAGLQEAKDSKMLLVKVRTGLDEVRKEIKEPALRRCQLIDSEARRIRDEIHALEQPILDQIQKELDRQAEEKRLAAEKWIRKLAAIKARPLDFISAAPDDVLAALEKARVNRDAVIAMFPEDMQEEATETFDGAIKQMEQMHITALDRADLEKRAANAPEPALVVGLDPATPGPDMTVVTVPPVRQAPLAPEAVVDTAGETKVTPGAGQVVIDRRGLWNELLQAAEVVADHYGALKRKHESIAKLQDAIDAVKAV